MKHSRYLWVKNCTDVSRSWHILTRYLKGKECVRSKKSFQIRCLTWSPHSLLAKSSEKMNIFSCCWFCCFFLVESRTFHFKKYLFGSITKWEEVKFLEINHLLVWSLLHNQKPKLFQRWSLKWNIINDTTLSSDPIFGDVSGVFFYMNLVFFCQQYIYGNQICIIAWLVRSRSFCCSSMILLRVLSLILVLGFVHIRPVQFKSILEI